ncbi:hypothetical protein DSECCO2_501680 [anaerobic digester metagenome]
MGGQFAAVLAGVVVGEALAAVHGLVQTDASRADELQQVVVEVNEAHGVVGVLGREGAHALAAAVGPAAAVGHDHGPDGVGAHVGDLAPGQFAVGFVVAGEERPVHGLPAFGRDGPVLAGGVEDLPPPELVLEVAVHFLGVGEEEDVGPFSVHGHVETGALFGQVAAEVAHAFEVFLSADGQIVARGQVVGHALVQGPWHCLAGAQALHVGHDRGDVDAGRADAGATAAARAQPGEVRGHDLADQAVGQQAHDLARVPAVHAGRSCNRATARAGAADQTGGKIEAVQEGPQFVTHAVGGGAHGNPCSMAIKCPLAERNGKLLSMNIRKSTFYVRK